MQNTIVPATVHTAETSGVAWPAIIGGALTAIGLTLVLTPLGSAFGLGMMPMSHHEEDLSKAITAASAIWIIVVQWISSGLGGYLTGRLRKGWAGAHTHEVFFRDTAHGFLSWALATFVGAAALFSVATHMIDGMGHGQDAMHEGPGAYYTDTLFRTDQANANVSAADRQEATRILATGAMHNGDMTATDRTYLTQLVAARTGMSTPDADKRVEMVVTREKTAMETAHKNMMKASLFLSFSMLVGAFIASAAGALGGRDRDIHYETGRFHA